MRPLFPLVLLALVPGAARAKSKADPPPKQLVMVWEDAPLYLAPDDSGPSHTAAERVLPRARRPFVLVSRTEDWVRVRSFSTADVGRTSICPYSGITDLQIDFYVTASDIAETIDVSSLPKRQSASIEWQLDGCRNPDAKAVALAPSTPEAEKDFEEKNAPPVGLGPYVPAKTPVSWKDGSAAGRTRFPVALPIQYYNSDDRICFERSLTGVGVWAGIGQEPLTLCVDRDKVRRL